MSIKASRLVQNPFATNHSPKQLTESDLSALRRQDLLKQIYEDTASEVILTDQQKMFHSREYYLSNSSTQKVDDMIARLTAQPVQASKPASSQNRLRSTRPAPNSEFMFSQFLNEEGDDAGN